MPEWIIEEPADIRKIFRRLGQEEKDQYRSAIKTLAVSDNPKNHGRYKKGLNCFSYEITKSFRILYDFNMETRTVSILSVDDHKGAYGRD